MLAHFIVIGDTDHDSQNEIVYVSSGGGDLFYTIIEEHGDNQYTLEYTGGDLYPGAIADLDADGKTDLVGQTGGWVRVYESSSASTHPTDLVWESEPMANVANRIAVGDTDRDGRMEILHSENGFSGLQTTLHIFECAGDNSYQEVFTSTLVGGVSKKIIADFDGDGLVEIGVYSRRWVYVYESAADNTWAIVWRDSTELNQQGGAEGGVDSDENGRPELFIMGNGPEGWTTIVYEASCDNQFSRVATFSQNEGASGVAFKTMARLQGPSGPWSYLMGGFMHFWIYRAEAVGRWRLVQEVPTTDPLLNGLFAFDLNRNGFDEIVWTSGGSSSLLLEAPLGTSVAQPKVVRGQFVVTPNPVRGVAKLVIDLGLTREAETVSVIDVTGRIVQRWRVSCSEPASHRWDHSGIPSGVYWLRLEDRKGRPLGGTRASIVR
jgi:hypothetical protein